MPKILGYVVVVSDAIGARYLGDNGLTTILNWARIFPHDEACLHKAGQQLCNPRRRVTIQPVYLAKSTQPTQRTSSYSPGESRVQSGLPCGQSFLAAN